MFVVVAVFVSTLIYSSNEVSTSSDVEAGIITISSIDSEDFLGKCRVKIKGYDNNGKKHKVKGVGGTCSEATANAGRLVKAIFEGTKQE